MLVNSDEIMNTQMQWMYIEWFSGEHIILFLVIHQKNKDQSSLLTII